MNYAPIARILIRYAVGVVVGMETANTLAGDPDIILFVSLGIGAAVEALYVLARRKGWAT